jgi:hypothetical protein
MFGFCDSLRGRCRWVWGFHLHRLLQLQFRLSANMRRKLSAPPLCFLFGAYRCNPAARRQHIFSHRITAEYPIGNSKISPLRGLPTLSSTCYKNINPLGLPLHSKTTYPYSLAQLSSRVAEHFTQPQRSVILIIQGIIECRTPKG